MADFGPSAYRPPQTACLLRGVLAEVNPSDRKRGGPRRQIVFLTENNPPRKDTRVWEQARTAAALGYGVTVVGPSTTSRYEVETVEGITVMAYPLRPSTGGAIGYLREYASATVRILRLVAQVRAHRRIDLVHVANPPDFLLLLVLPLRLGGTKFVFDHHDLAPELFETKFGARRSALYVLRMLERTSFRIADAVVTTNESYARVAAERGSRAKQLIVAPNYPNLDSFTPTAPDPSLKKDARHLIAWVGTMGSQDGIDLAVLALGHLATLRSDWHAVFAGQGEMLSPARDLSRSLGLDGRLEFPGHQSREAVRRLISTADVCLASDPKTKFNDLSTMLKVMEYLAIGRAVVASDLAETRRVAQDAAIYPLDDTPLAFARGIDLLLSDRARRERMGARGRVLMMETGGWRESADRLAALYQELLAT
jgi:glycosyltransferase involved in cell wall biosynthesis